MAGDSSRLEPLIETLGITHTLGRSNWVVNPVDVG